MNADSFSQIDDSAMSLLCRDGICQFQFSLQKLVNKKT